MTSIFFKCLIYFGKNQQSYRHMAVLEKIAFLNLPSTISTVYSIYDTVGIILVKSVQ